MTKPQSFSVLLQLPSRQLESVFEICPELKENLVLHVQSFTPHQRAHIPRSLLQILEKDGKKDEKKPKPEKPDKEQIDPEEEEEEGEEDDSTKGDKSPKRTRLHTREALKDKRKSRRSRSRSRSPRKKREKSAGEESASEGEIN